MSRALTHTEKARFLACLSLGLSVTKACKEAKIPRRNAYYWRSEDIEFADAWDDAKAASLETLEDHLRQRATDPNDKASHLLLMFLLKKLDPTYRENYKTETKKAVAETKEFEFEPEELDAALTILNAAKARKAPETD
jgi:predicted kinase